MLNAIIKIQVILILTFAILTMGQCASMMSQQLNDNLNNLEQRVENLGKNLMR